ncbi:DUF6778 family protein [Aliiroseovarius lamellibrachiae]|uniref:DUF6778 family protein n=1 Tax=Aliiroseovarius lamellibrachiae TaxID=1924933 RepID=UPI001BE0693E|nr:DUF6778 family protein [Aliiroseovarius lamellibrachiae]MBT2131960.1 hypothetical protein [Aliiroseovarius lamellibrachiae]
MGHVVNLGKIILGCVALAALSACVKPGDVTRGATPKLELLTATEIASQAVTQFNVTDVRVNVPRDLKVSEANTFKPKADIVWREDPLGDRYQQVEVILQAAFERGVSTLNEGRDVVLDIQLQEFHALTQRTRYTYGGTHAIRFSLTVLDAETGAVVEPARVIQADLRAFGGGEALAAEARGETQKVRITDHLAKVVLFEMTRPRDFLPDQPDATPDATPGASIVAAAPAVETPAVVQ